MSTLPLFKSHPLSLMNLFTPLLTFSVLITQIAFPNSIPLIFDTDMDTDCDDAGALAMVHAFADRGEIQLLATLVSSEMPGSGACTAAINTYFGRPDLPVGVPKQPGNVSSGDKRSSKYTAQIAREFPNTFPPLAEAPDAVKLYRKILAGQKDHSVVIVTVGYLTNIRYLLESGPDEYSPLNGTDLVKLKVKEWVCMGSRYPADLDPKKWGNFKPDGESASRAIRNWPVLLTFTGGGDFANSMATGAELNNLPADNPVRRVYELYFGGKAKNRHSADQIAVMVAVRGTGRPWKLVTQGSNHIFEDGRHEWREEPDNPLHQYISALENETDAAEMTAEISRLMLHVPASTIED